MRWKAIIIVIPLLIGLIFGLFCFKDLMIEWSIVNSLQTVIGAKVEAHPVHFDPFSLTITIGNLQITNPNNTWRNLIEADNLKLGVAGKPLLWGKTVIEEINVEDLILNAPRKTNGKIKIYRLPGPLGEAQAKLNQDIAEIPSLNPEVLKGNLDLKPLLANYQFKTHLDAKVINGKLDATKEKWDENLAKLQETKTKINELHQKLIAFQNQPVQTVADLKPKYDLLNSLKDQTITVQNQINSTVNGYQSEFNQLKTDIDYLKNSALADYHALMKLAKLPSLESFNFAEALFGKAILNEAALFTGLADQLQKMVPISLESPPKEKHPRGGQEISFPGQKVYPRLLIKHVSISGQSTPDSKYRGYYAKGVVEGITTEPVVYGVPMQVKVFGQAPNKAYLDIKATLDNTKPQYRNQIYLNVGNLPVPEYKLPENKFFPDQIGSGMAKVKTDFRLTPGYYFLNMKISLEDLVCKYNSKISADDLAAEIIRETLSGINRTSLDFQLESLNKKMKMKLDSDINELIAARFNQVVGEKLNKFKTEIMDRVNAELEKKKQELEAERQRILAEGQKKIDEVQGLLDQEKKKLEELKAQLEKKKLELEGKVNDLKNQKQQELEAEKNKAIEEKKTELKDKLNIQGLFNKPATSPGN